MTVSIGLGRVTQNGPTDNPAVQSQNTVTSKSQPENKPKRSSLPMQFLGCQNQVNSASRLGIVATAADLWKPCNLIGDTVFWRREVIFLNSKNAKRQN